MNINGIDYYIKDFEVLTDLSFQYQKLDNGHRSVTDRGTSGDYYGSRITIYDTLETLDTLLDYFRDQRIAETISITFESTEQIFGADIDYTNPLGVTIIDDSGTSQSTWKGFETSINMQLPVKTFLGPAEFPTLNYSSHTFEPLAENTRNVRFHYDTTAYIFDSNSDSGIFTGEFFFTDLEMRKLRRFHATNRGAPFYINDIPGLDYMFGRKRNLIFPVHVKLLSVKERYDGPNRWACKIRLVEEV